MARRLFRCAWIVCAVLIAARSGLEMHASGLGRQSAGVVESPLPSPESRKTIDQYCVTCHSAHLKSGGLVLEGTDSTTARSNAEIWEKVVRKVRAGAMPPQGARRPDAATLHALVSSLAASLDEAAAARPNPGRPLLHRLNRAEYRNAIRDLLALDVDVTTLLPPDDSAYGFDNISDVLGVSPSLQERYLAAAGRISRLAVGDPSMRPGSDTYRPAC
jgi:Protein of unknown function (DUF1587)/Planctomycete cytochrome C